LSVTIMNCYIVNFGEINVKISLKITDQGPML
jgi:hypothetical protein